MGALARHHGAFRRVPRVAKRATRTLAEIAVENAVEGCVRETYGAVVAVYQSFAAADRRVRAAMKAIATDEARHAALAWRVGAWIDLRLSAADKRHVAKASRAAVEEIGRLIDSDPPASVRRFAGLPAPREARRMFSGLCAGLWHC
jgi:hypothetical protein